jgi:hypothetical protein
VTSARRLTQSQMPVQTKINAKVTSARRLTQSQMPVQSDMGPLTSCYAELDSDAEMCTVNDTTLVLDFIQQVINFLE